MTMSKKLFSPRFLSLWAINGPLQKERLFQQLDGMRRDGLDGVVFHPRFYPNAPEYLSEEYLVLVSETILHAKELGLAFWIYDEDGWPSGVAGGRIVKEFPQFRGGLLTLHEGPGENPWHRFNHKGKTWSLSFSQTTELDYFNPEACRCFLHLVHDRYREGLDPQAWAHVEALFCDEPEYGIAMNIHHLAERGGISWSPILPELYRERYQRDIHDELPYIFFNDPEGRHEDIRIRFWEFMSEVLAKGFFEPYSEWCKREGKLFTGHLKGEEHPLFQVMMHGSLHRCARYFDLPGIDALERHPSGDYFPRQSASIAHQFQQGRCMVEAMGGAGWGSSPEAFERYMLWLTNNGATDLVLHLQQYQLKSSAIRDWPPSLPADMTWRKAFPELLKRIRHNTDARHVVEADTLVVAPYRAIMAGFEPHSVLTSNIHNCATYPDTPAGKINRAFVAKIKDFPKSYHLADERSLEDDLQFSDGVLTLGKHAYTTVILDDACQLNPAVEARLGEFTARGGRILKVSELQSTEVQPPYSNQVSDRIQINWQKASPAVTNALLLEVVREDGSDWHRLNYQVKSSLDDVYIEFADDLAQAEYGGHPLEVDVSPDGSRVRLPSVAKLPGGHQIRFRLQEPSKGPLFVWISGNFCVYSQSPWLESANGTVATAGPWILAPIQQHIAETEWISNGWPFAQGSFTLTGQFTLKNRWCEQQMIGLGGIVADAAILRIDGGDPCWIWGPDWGSSHFRPLEAGRHNIELSLIPSTYNRFGPHHHIDGDRPVVSPAQFDGHKNFADREDAPIQTLDALWRFKPLKTASEIFKCDNCNRKPVRQRFTLTELLVVIAILSILLMLLQPALQNITQKTTGLSCLNNLRQIGAATFTYGGDNNGNIPGRDYEGCNLWFSYTTSAQLPVQLNYPSSAPQSGGLLHLGGYLRGPKVYFCPGREAPDIYSLEKNLCKEVLCKPNDYWHCLRPGGPANMGYMLAQGNWNCGNMDTPNFNFGKWTQLDHVNPGYILGMDITGNNGLDDLRGASKCNHGFGVNVVLFDGSAGFQEDPTSHLELYFTFNYPNVFEGRPNRRNKQHLSPTAWLYINNYGRSQAWVDSLYQ
jgi:type II secretory pathway pseudopilin PulG